MNPTVEVSLRPFQWADLPALVTLRNAASVLDRDEGRISLEELQHEFNSPNFSPESDCFVALTPAAQIVGYSSLRLEAATGRGFGQGTVHPYYRRQGIGTHLLRATDTRLLERAEREVAPDMSVSAMRLTLDENESQIALFTAEGYQPVRSAYTMRIELGAMTAAPPLPDGVRLRDFEPARDGLAVYEVDRDSFRDHWGYVEWSFDLWQHYTLGRAEFDPALWLIAIANGEIVGICLGFPVGDDQPNSGYIDVLAVRPAWRRRGLGLALLQHSFHRFRGRGYTTVGLDVDTENTTNAVALYERAGMSVHRKMVIYEKVLRL